MKANNIVVTLNIEKLKRRDRHEFGLLYEEYKNRIYSFLYVKTGHNEDLASDLLHDTFASAIDSAHTLKSGSNIPAWLFTIAFRRFTDHLRAQYKSNGIANIDDYTIKADDNTEDEFSRQEDIASLHIVLSRIKVKYRDIVVMKYFNGMSDKEISERINKSVKAVESLLVRARESIRREFAQDQGLTGGDI